MFVLIIYDITSNKKRVKLARLLQGYGFRVQKSAFEAVIVQSRYEKLLKVLPKYASGEDSIKIYKIIGKAQVQSFGKNFDIQQEDVIVV